MMITPEMLLALVGIVSSFVALAVTIFSWRRQKSMTQEQRDAIKRTLSPAKPETLTSIGWQLKSRLTSLKRVEEKLKSPRTRKFREPWLEELAEIIAKRRQQKGG